MGALLAGEAEDAGGVVGVFVIVDFVGEGHVEAAVHEEASGEGFAFEGEGLVVDAVKFGDDVGGVGVEAGHGDSGQLLVHECLGFPPEEHGVVFFGGDVHERPTGAPCRLSLSTK